MVIELIPQRGTQVVKLKCSDGSYTTETSMAGYLTISKAMEVAIENHYKSFARHQIDRILK